MVSGFPGSQKTVPRMNEVPPPTRYPTASALEIPALERDLWKTAGLTSFRTSERHAEKTGAIRGNNRMSTSRDLEV